MISFLGQLGDIQYPFYVLARKETYGRFFFESIFINSNYVYLTYPDINFQQDLAEVSNLQCLTAKLDNITRKLDLEVTDCLEKHTIICRKVFFVKPNCKQRANLTIFENPFK